MYNISNELLKKVNEWKKGHYNDVPGFPVDAVVGNFVDKFFEQGVEFWKNFLTAEEHNRQIENVKLAHKKIEEQGNIPMISLETNIAFINAFEEIVKITDTNLIEALIADYYYNLIKSKYTETLIFDNEEQYCLGKITTTAKREEIEDAIEEAQAKVVDEPDLDKTELIKQILKKQGFEVVIKYNLDDEEKPLYL